ncbi:MAG: hypothetical protein R2878_02610 [Thermoleophilia bacterium]
MARTTTGRGGRDADLLELLSRLKSLDENCLTDLQGGLAAMLAGDLTVEVRPSTSPLETTSNDAVVSELATVFNSMLARAQAGLTGYNQVREIMRGALGDQSCLSDLTQRLDSLHRNCLTDLEAGLAQVAEGDLTREVTPVTSPLQARPGRPSATSVRCSTACSTRPSPPSRAIAACGRAPPESSVRSRRAPK